MTRNIARHFEYAIRTDGSEYWRLTDDAPDWLHDAVYEAHDGELPNDWRYAQCYGIVEYLDQSDNPATDGDFEYADTAVEPYTYELLQWYAADLDRISYADENTLEFGPGEGLGHTLLLGQAYAIASMFRTIAAAYALSA